MRFGSLNNVWAYPFLLQSVLEQVALTHSMPHPPSVALGIQIPRRSWLFEPLWCSSRGGNVCVCVVSYVAIPVGYTPCSVVALPVRHTLCPWPICQGRVWPSLSPRPNRLSNPAKNPPDLASANLWGRAENYGGKFQRQFPCVFEQGDPGTVSTTDTA